MRNRYRRERLPEHVRKEVAPKNILMIGPTGVGKTEIARRLATLAGAPFIKVEATKYTEVGYVGRDVESMVRDLAEAAVRMVSEERRADVREAADNAAVERIVDILHPETRAPQPQAPNPFAASFGSIFGNFGNQPQAPAATQTVARTLLRRRGRARARGGESRRAARLLRRAPHRHRGRGGGAAADRRHRRRRAGDGGMGGNDMSEMLGGLLPKKKVQKRVTVADARRIFAQQEADKLIDMDAVKREALRRAGDHGIVFIDEIDKVAGREGGRGPDVSREGVQRDILPIVEGSTVQTKHGPLSTDHVLFIAAGAFHVSKPSDLIPELQGRFPVRVELDSLTAADFETILTQPENALIGQYRALLGTDGVELDVTSDAIAEIAQIAMRVNEQTENIGARRLHTVLERVLDEIAFRAPEEGGRLVIDAAYVRARLESIAGNADLSSFIL